MGPTQLHSLFPACPLIQLDSTWQNIVSWVRIDFMSKPGSWRLPLTHKHLGCQTLAAATGLPIAGTCAARLPWHAMTKAYKNKTKDDKCISLKTSGFSKKQIAAFKQHWNSVLFPILILTPSRTQPSKSETSTLGPFVSGSSCKGLT